MRGRGGGAANGGGRRPQREVRLLQGILQVEVRAHKVRSGEETLVQCFQFLLLLLLLEYLQVLLLLLQLLLLETGFFVAPDKYGFSVCVFLYLLLLLSFIAHRFHHST